MLFLIGLGYKLLRFAVLIVVLTIVGQVPVKGSSIENHYHRFVNSRNFQKTYWTLILPFTWTGEKIAELFQRPENLSNIR